MAHPVIHAEIRSADPDATRAFFSELFGWTYTDGAFPGYSFVDTGAEGAIPTAIGPLQGGADHRPLLRGCRGCSGNARKGGEARRENDPAGSGSARRDLRRFR